MKMGTNQQFSLRWNNYVQHITCAFDSLRSDEDLVDVTLSCEGRKILAHKMLLSACSTYFKNVFKENPCKHPVIIFRNVRFEDLVAIVDFMYHGEVNVEQEQLSSFLTTAEMLAVQGLTDGTGQTNDNYKEENRKRHQASLLETSLLGTAQDLSNTRQNHQQKTTPRPNTSHPSNPVSFFNPTPTTQPSTPTPSRKRKFSPVKVVNNSISSKDIVESELKQTKKRNVLPSSKEEADTTETPLVPKVEVDYDDNDSSYSEQESGMIDVSQLMDKTIDKDGVELFSTNSRDSPHPSIKGEGVPGSEIDKGLSTISEQALLKPGTSGNVDSMQETYLIGMEEEYLEECEEEEAEEVELIEEEAEEVIENDEMEEDIIDDDDDEDTLSESEEHQGFATQSYVVVRDPEGTEYLEEDSIVQIIKEENESCDLSGDVEYIYAEGVSDNNEIIIGQVPAFQCKFCGATFKRLDSLYKHNSVHKGKTVCPVCKAVFSRVAHRTRHMRLKHPDIEMVEDVEEKKPGRRKKEKLSQVEEVDEIDQNFVFNSSFIL